MISRLPHAIKNAKEVENNHIQSSILTETDILVIGKGIAGTLSMYYLMDFLLANKLLFPISITWIDNEVDCPPCSLNSTAIGAIWGQDPNAAGAR